ncbi:Stk1 family PASTA domain-containing Ser/Thr kinase [Aquibacillus sediminis]|uniref:Stk1 family PASTA domain-containing Ser/Thr kinase n=1 Tax=Aquibacillus sediminis TaxID=2574734 RepID=UPI001108DA95|nr:Stk1 family PASTA domain-containing Ser/Thr kinase [Aquibacillus sediminis]
MLDREILNERYKVKKMIGGGGMANVYLARDIILDREVAIKVLRLEYANDEEFIARFHREAQSATSLAHPNIVNIYDVGEEDNIYYMVMEYVEGMTLKKYIQMYGPIEVQESIDIMKQVTSAISHAHENDIVHRDIKPQNILINPFGQVKVTDFGIAVALSATSLTQTNSVLGSVHYLSPEQARGGMANKKSDIYSLGIVLFELLTGRLPFSGQSAVSIALKHLQSNTPSIRRWNPNLPQSVENVVLKATAKDPFHRYYSVDELHEELETALDPDRLDEEIFTPPEDQGEATKAIPIITDQTFKEHKTTQDTIVTSDHTNPHLETKNQDNDKVEKKRKKVIITVSILLFVVLGSIISALFIIPGLFQPKDVTIPSVEGMEYEEAYDQLNDLQLNVERKTEHNDEVEEGMVIKTAPSEGRTVKEGDTVTVYSSLGKEKIAFDNYVGRDINQVTSILNQLGFDDTDIRIYRQFDDEPEDQILTQVPSPNKQVVPEETNVIFEVSKGPEPVTLQSLEDLTQQEAVTYLDNENLNATITEEYSDEVEEGKVIRQQPDAFTQVEQRSDVEIVISLGPEDIPPITHSVEIDVPYTEGNQNGNGPPQEVRIYVNDLNRTYAEPVETRSIQEDWSTTIELVIPANGEATYKVETPEDVTEETVTYEEVEGE